MTATFETDFGSFAIPSEPDARRVDSEFTVKSIIGWRDAELARRGGEWGDRCGQEYSYRRAAPEDARSAIDIGCNVGAFLVWACAYWWPTIERVWAYDPNEMLADMAHHNARLVSAGRDIRIYASAVTVDPAPNYREHVQTGRSHTWGDRDGQPADGWQPPRPVPAIHPIDLPAADVLKIDAEGVEVEVFENYQHWAGVKVALWEWHITEHRATLEAICQRAGLVQRKNDCGQDSQGVQCWSRP